LFYILKYLSNDSEFYIFIEFFKKPTSTSKTAKISAKIELKRRGSWPIAYFNTVFYKYNS